MTAEDGRQRNPTVSPTVAREVDDTGEPETDHASHDNAVAAALPRDPIAA
jgi:hypothetical protein